MNDTISREAVADAINGIECTRHTTWYEFYQKVMTAVEKLPTIHPELGTNLAEVSMDCISRQAAIDGKICIRRSNGVEIYDDYVVPVEYLKQLPPAQPEIIRCKDCIYYDPPHVENNGVRYEYDEMPADAFDALGTGLVNAEYGINIGGRCCVDYYCKNYSDDKRVFVREDNYCGRAERRTDEGSD